MATWSREDIARMVGFMESVNNDLVKAGEFVHAEGLTEPTRGRTVRANPDGSVRRAGRRPGGTT